VLIGRVDMAGYSKIVAILKGAGLVEETRANLLRWVGPEIGEARV